MENGFVDRLNRIIGAAKLNPAAFAKQIGVKPNVVYGWQESRNIPGMNSLRKIHIAFVINLNWLIMGKGGMYCEKDIPESTNIGAVSEGKESYGDYKLLYDKALARIALMEKTIKDKEEIIHLLKAK